MKVLREVWCRCSGVPCSSRRAVCESAGRLVDIIEKEDATKAVLEKSCQSRWDRSNRSKQHARHMCMEVNREVIKLQRRHGDQRDCHDVGGACAGAAQAGCGENSPCPPLHCASTSPAIQSDLPFAGVTLETQIWSIVVICHEVQLESWPSPSPRTPNAFSLNTPESLKMTWQAWRGWLQLGRGPLGDSTLGISTQKSSFIPTSRLTSRSVQP